MQPQTPQYSKPPTDFTSAMAALIDEYIDYYEERSSDPVTENIAPVMIYHMRRILGSLDADQREIACSIYNQNDSVWPAQIEILRTRSSRGSEELAILWDLVLPHETSKC